MDVVGECLGAFVEGLLVYAFEGFLPSFVGAAFGFLTRVDVPPGFEVVWVVVGGFVFFSLAVR